MQRSPDNGGRWGFGRAAPLLGAALGGVVGLVAFASSLGLQLVDPRFIDWLMYGDTRIHFLGWHVFRAAPWESPLGANSLFGHPVGSSVALTDSIPVLAIPFKLLDGVLPARFQYIGLWLLICYVLQGVFGALLMRVVTPRVGLQALGAALFVMTPVLLHRVGHPALTAHWLVLAALWLHFRDGRSLAGWFVIVSITAATHAYLSLMVLAIVAAHFAGVALADPRRALRPIATLAALLTVFALVFWQAGYLVVESAGDLQASGFGQNAMNVLGPIVPLQGSRLLGNVLLPDVPQGYEGYAYLGTGVLFLLVPALLHLVRSIGRWHWQREYLAHLPFALALCVLTALAVSPVVTAGHSTLFEYSEKWWGPLAVFRASGRMFWPVIYAITFGILYAVTRFRFPAAVALMTAAVAIQAVDVSRGYSGARGTRTLEWRNPLASDFWRVAPRHYQRLTLMPTNMCAQTGFVEYEPFALIAGDFAIAVNAGEAARYDVQKVRQHCDELQANFRGGAVSADALYVLLPELAPAFAQAAQTPVACAPVDRYVVCFVADTYAKWQDDFDITASVLPPADDFLVAYKDLDEEYGRMQRPATASPGTLQQRVAALRMYLLYRVTGCDHAGARDKVLRTLRGMPELRLCGNPAATRMPVPPANEAFAFRRDLDAVFTELRASQASAHIDQEGEAVWLREYAFLRVAGDSEARARDVVREKVRAIARR